MWQAIRHLESVETSLLPLTVANIICPRSALENHTVEARKVILVHLYS